MSRVVFVDANIPIYAAGRDHPYKEPCSRIIRTIADKPEHFVTNAEVLQELLHRYLRSGRWRLGREVLREFVDVMRGRIESVSVEDVLLAADMADPHTDVSARDMVHAAVMKRLDVSWIISADADFDRLEGVERLDPARVDEWGGMVVAGDIN